MRNMSSQSVSVMSMSGAYFRIPALLTRISTSGALLARSSTKRASFRSPTTVSMAPPPHCFASVSSSGLRRPVAMILAPACASAIAVALPMPALAPVTSTALPDNGMLIRPPL